MIRQQFYITLHKRIFFVLLGILFMVYISACSDKIKPTSNNRSKDVTSMITIKENAVGLLDGWSLGVANIWERSYSMPNGQTKTGITAQIAVWRNDNPALEEQIFIVYQGGFIELGSARYEIITITEGTEHGHIVINTTPINQ